MSNIFWNRKTVNNVEVMFAGALTPKVLTPLVEAIISHNTPDFQKLGKLLTCEYQAFGLIIKAKDFVFAACDRIQGYPVFYNEKTGEISACAQDVTDLPLYDAYDEQSVLEFSMAGYVLGPRTMHRDVQRLQAGEMIYIDRAQAIPVLTKNRYYSYLPSPSPETKPFDELKKELGYVLDACIQRMITSAKGRPICVPLSGGLDSRLIIAKLHEHGAQDLYTFSYGLAGNFEAKMAEKVAKQIGVDWFMVPANPKSAQSLFSAPERKQYESYAHGFSVIPSYVEYEVLHTIRAKGLIPENAVIVNGQTGDFISGGHVPPCLYESDAPTKNDLFSYIIKKHCSLWTNLKSDKNIEQVEAGISKALHLDELSTHSKDVLMAYYECFEWQERQCKMIINGQRAYEFFGYDWRLPLWDTALMDFFNHLPWAYKYRQNLFKSYLKDYNYKGVFDYPSATPEVWQRHQYWILCYGRMLSVLGLHKQKTEFYKRKLYHSDAHWQYALFGESYYRHHYKFLRNMVSLAVLNFLEEQNIPFPEACLP